MSDNVQIKAFCDWQIFGDVEPKEHLEELLRPWLSRKSGDGFADADDNDLISDLGVMFTSDKGPFGLRYIQFMVVTPVTIHELNDVKDVIKARLDRMVGDSDVRVLWVERA